MLGMPCYPREDDKCIDGAMVGKAAEDFDGESGVIDVWIGRV